MTAQPRKARLAVVGTGHLAQSQHIPNLQRAEHAELTVLCDLRREVLEALGARYPACRLETDCRRVFADPAVDGVIIATREDTHVALTLEALAAGKHVYVEKPLANTEADCARVLAAQRRAGRLVAVGMNRRMAPAYRYAKRLLDGAGGATNMYYRITDSYCFDWGPAKNYPPGVRVVHETCHVFDVLRFFAGSEVRAVYCASARPDDEIITLRFAGGAIATILSSGYVHSDFPKEHFEAVAKEGALSVLEFCEVRQYSLSATEPPVTTFPGHGHPDHDLTHVLLLKELGAEALHAVRGVTWRAAQRLAELERRGAHDTTEYRTLEAVVAHAPLRNYFMDKGWLAAVDHFAECIRTGRPFEGATAADAFQAARISDAAIASRNTGQVVALAATGSGTVP